MTLFTLLTSTSPACCISTLHTLGDVVGCWTSQQVLEVASAQGEFCRFAAQAMADIAEAGHWEAVIGCGLGTVVVNIWAQPMENM